MAFTEVTDNADYANYEVYFAHVATGLSGSLKIVSGSAYGDISQTDANQVYSDLKDALEPTFSLTFKRTRAAQDEWTQDPA